MVLLGVLVILWAVLIGSWLKDRASSRTGDSVSAFRDQLHTLQRTQPGGRRSALRSARPEPVRVAPFGPGRPLPARGATVRTEMQQRRRDVLLVLAGATVLSFLAAFVVGGLLLFVVNACCVLALAGYVVALLQQQRIAQEKRLKVRYLPNQAPGAARASARPSAPAASRPGRVPAGRQAEAALLRRSVAN